MALFRNLCVNLRDCLCDVPRYASAQSLDFLDLANPRQVGTELETDASAHLLHGHSWMGTSPLLDGHYFENERTS